MNKLNSITSATNPFVKKLRALASSRKARQEHNLFIIEGWRGIDSLLKHPGTQYQLEQIVISETWEKKDHLPNHLPITQLPDPLFSKISDVKNAQGILGIVRPLPSEPTLPEQDGHYLLLDNIRDPGNLGTLIRSAVGAGYRGIFLYGDCVETFNPKVIRSTMGTFAHIPIRPITLPEAQQLKSHSFEFCVTTGLGGENLYSTALSKRTALVIGSEAHGVSDELFQLANRKITIPLETACESLNAAIAGSICMFHITRGRS